MNLLFIAGLSANLMSLRADDVVSQTIRLKGMDPRQIMQMSTLGLDQISFNLKDGSITLKGPRESVSALRSKIEAADVAPVQVVVEMRVVRFQVDANGQSMERLDQNPMVTTLNGSPATISTKSGEKGTSIQFLPRVNADGTVTLQTDMQLTGDEGEIVLSGKSTRKVTPGETVRICGMTDAADKNIRRAVQKGDLPRDAGGYSGYYLEAKTVILK